MKNQCHHLVTDTQRGLSNRINVSSPHLCSVMMCGMLCSSELSHHNLSHNLSSAWSTRDITSTVCTLCCPSSSWITEAKPHNNRIKQMCYPSEQNQHLKQLQDETESYTSLLQPAGLPHASKVIKISLIKENTLHMSKSQGTCSSTALLCSLSGLG